MISYLRLMMDGLGFIPILCMSNATAFEASSRYSENHNSPKLFLTKKGEKVTVQIGHQKLLERDKAPVSGANVKAGLLICNVHDIFKSN